MSKFLKVIFTIVGIILITIVGFIAWDQLTAPPYYQKVVGVEALNNEEIGFIKKNFKLPDSEKIVTVYSLYRSIKSGGIILTNIRLISFLEGENLDSCFHSVFEDIEKINLEKSESFKYYSRIKITMKDSIKFSFDVSRANNMDDFLYERLLKKFRE